MRRILVAFLFACCVLFDSCAGNRTPSVNYDTDDDVGCHLKAEEVVFRFDSSEYVNVTRDDSGKWLSISDITIESVSVAGDFNEWSKLEWRMSKIGEGIYELRKNLRNFSSRSEWQFKFVVNGFYWVEPPTDAPNRAPSGLWGANQSYNLVLRVQ